MLVRHQARFDLLRELGLPLLALVVLLAALIAIVWGLRNWLRRSETVAPSAEELLLQFRRMAADGKLSDEEFRTIQRRLTREMHSAREDASSPHREEAR